MTANKKFFAVSYSLLFHSSSLLIHWNTLIVQSNPLKCQFWNLCVCLLCLSIFFNQTRFSQDYLLIIYAFLLSCFSSIHHGVLQRRCQPSRLQRATETTRNHSWGCRHFVQCLPLGDNWSSNVINHSNITTTDFTSSFYYFKVDTQLALNYFLNCLELFFSFQFFFKLQTENISWFAI